MGHSRGEWKVRNRKQAQYIGIDNLDHKIFPFFVSMPTPFSLVGRAGAIVTEGLISQEEAEANANLIAAAPIGDELANAIICMVFDDWDDFCEVKEIARKFKAKAKGG